MPISYPPYRGTWSSGTYRGNPADIFGSRVAPIGMPNPAADLSSVYPNLSGTNTAASAAILSKLRGELSPATINAIQDAAATFGVSSGMPGFSPGSLNWNRSLRDIGRTSEQVQQQGLEGYNATLPTVSRTQTVAPETQFNVNETNAVNRAAPNPADAQSYAQQLFERFLAATRTPAGGTGSSGGGSIPWYAQGGREALENQWGQSGSLPWVLNPRYKGVGV